MPTDPFNDFLRQLRLGKLDATKPVFPANLLLADFLKQVRNHYPVVFQERSIGRKTELGLARSLQFELLASRNGLQMFPRAQLLPVFRRCLLISTYDDYVSGIAVAKTIRIRRSRPGRDQLAITMSSGHKLDKMPDRWELKTLQRRSTVLSEAFLRIRGWQFDRMQPFALQTR